MRFMWLRGNLGRVRDHVVGVSYRHEVCGSMGSRLGRDRCSRLFFCGRRAAAYLGAGHYRAANGGPITTIPVHIASIAATLQVTTAKEQFKLLDVSLVPIRALPVMPGSNRVARMPRLNYPCPAGQQHALESGPNYVLLSEFGSWRRTSSRPRVMRPEMKGSSCLMWARCRAGLATRVGPQGSALPLGTPRHWWTSFGHLDGTQMGVWDTPDVAVWDTGRRRFGHRWDDMDTSGHVAEAHLRASSRYQYITQFHLGEGVVP